MSAAASPPSIPRTPSSVRRHHSHTASSDRPAPPPTTTPTRTEVPPSPRRHSSHTAPQPHSRSASGTAQPPLANVARRDQEQSNLARPSSSRQPSDNREPPASSTLPTRSDSTRNAASAQPAHSRYHSQDMPNSTTANGTMPPAATTSSQVRRRTTIDATTGHWDLGKTIGAGSMGKVKLARNKETGEQVN